MIELRVEGVLVRKAQRTRFKDGRVSALVRAQGADGRECLIDATAPAGPRADRLLRLKPGAKVSVRGDLCTGTLGCPVMLNASVATPDAMPRKQPAEAKPLSFEHLL